MSSVDVVIPQGMQGLSKFDHNETLAHFAEFEGYLHLAQQSYARNNLRAAAIYASMAAQVAALRHAGFFVSPSLERLLINIGRRVTDNSNYRRKSLPINRLDNVLHICTEVVEVGGHTKMLCRWIEADDTRTHSLALTRHRRPISKPVNAAVHKAGGKIFHLDRNIGGPLQWAKRLRQLARNYDVIILHVYGDDIIPMIAFAEPEKFPPLILLNHADHMFWLGANITDLTINLRDAAQDISIFRRGIESRRNIVVPTIVSPSVRVLDRGKAKTALGIDPDSIVLFSAARSVKYRTLAGVTYADTHIEILNSHKNAVLLVLGADDPEDWRRAKLAVGGRIKSLPAVPDPRPYFEAADIYVDSFPFVSSTSMMEAGGYGLPLVTRFYGSDEARIVAINHPGLLASALCAKNDSEYLEILSQLIVDAEFRDRTGQMALDNITRFHLPPNWFSFLDAALNLAKELPPLDNSKFLQSNDMETPFFGEPDCLLYDLFGFDIKAQDLVIPYLGLLPIRQRMTHWAALYSAGHFYSRKHSVRCLMPDWMSRLVDYSRLRLRGAL